MEIVARFKKKVLLSQFHKYRNSLVQIMEEQNESAVETMSQYSSNKIKCM